jgi:hypothetical protein
MAATSAVFTIARVAALLGEDEEWLSDVALEMDPEDGRLTIYDANDEGSTGFTSFGIDNLKELIKMHKEDPTIIERYRKPLSRNLNPDTPCRMIPIAYFYPYY